MNTILLPGGTRFDPNQEEMTMPEKVQPPADKTGLIDGTKFTPVPTGNGESIPRTIATVANELEANTLAMIEAEQDVKALRARGQVLTDELHALLGRKPRKAKGAP